MFVFYANADFERHVQMLRQAETLFCQDHQRYTPKSDQTLIQAATDYRKAFFARMILVDRGILAPDERGELPLDALTQQFVAQHYKLPRVQFISAYKAWQAQHRLVPAMPKV